MIHDTPRSEVSDHYLGIRFSLSCSTVIGNLGYRAFNVGLTAYQHEHTDNFYCAARKPLDLILEREICFTVKSV